MLDPRLHGALCDDPLHVIDVGGAMGPETRWQIAPRNCIRFMSFEPDVRSHEDLTNGANGDVVLPVGLANGNGKRTLHLTAGPFASSLYPPNASVLKDFGVWPWYEPAGEATVEVDRLDSCIARYPNWRADFIKVDVEGADLDVLKGGREVLDTTFGLQVEVAFLDRNNGAPNQAEIDLWLREVGFRPHLLYREHWIRANGVHGAYSQPQLSWGDAVYFRDRNWVTTHLGSIDDASECERSLARFILMLLVYGAHDYASDLAATARSMRLVSEEAASAIDRSITQSIASISVVGLRGSAALLIAILLAAPLILIGKRGRGLACSLVATQAAPLFEALTRAARRGGLAGSCVSDI